MATIKQIGGSFSITLDYNDEFEIIVNGESLHKQKMEADMEANVYMRRRNKPAGNSF